MQFAADVVDFGNAPEIHVSGLVSITRISPGIIRVTYYTEHETEGGAIERRLCLSVVWDAEDYLAVAPLFTAAADDVRTGRVQRKKAAN